MSREAQSLARSLVAGLGLVCVASCLVSVSFAARLKSASPGTRETVSPPAPAVVPVMGAHPGPLASPRLSVDADYRLSPGDWIHVSVYGEPTLSGSFRVGPGGSIAMPILGQIGLRGLSLREAQALITCKVAVIVRRPSVTVTMDEISSIRKVYVSGEVSRTGAISLPFASTLTDALAAAGPGAFADLRQVRLTHPGGRPFDVDCSGLRGEGPLGAEHQLEYGDTIFVPRVREEITVMGEVRAPGSVLLPVGQEVTVIDALRMSQGFTPLADRSRAVLLRPGADPISIDLEGLLKRGDISEDRRLRGGDVLVVHQAGSIAVVGQVRNPQVFNSPAEVPILQALASAGGPLPTGDLKRAEIIRGGETITVDLQKFLDEGEAPGELALRPGDVLVVPRGEGQNILVTGALARTGVVNLRGVDQRDLLRVITISGPIAQSDLTRVTVYRDNKTLVRDLEAITKGGDLSQNLDLEPGDLVVVPTKEIDSVLVTGLVARRGVVQITRKEDHDLLRIVTLAGPSAMSDLSRVMIHRGDETIVRDLKAALDRGDLDESILVQNGDVIVVPEMVETLVVTGAVQRSGLVRLINEEWRDLANLVMMSGPLPIADLTRVTVHRGDDRIVVNVKDFLEKGDRTQTIELEDGDLVRVPRVEETILLSGALTRGGVLKLYDGLDRDLVSLILAAGPTPMADLEHVTIHRGEQRLVRNLRAMIESGERDQTLDIEPGDIITVPMRQVHNVLITGAVGRPALVRMADDQRRDLASLVTISGPLPNADLTKIAVHRGGMTTTRDLQAYIDTGLDVYTMELEDGDVVVVPRGEHSILVMGAVMRAGTLQIVEEQQRDLLRVVTLAGPVPAADLSKVTVYRGDEKFVKDLKKLADEGDLSQTMLLQDGDIVKVPAFEESILVAGAAFRLGVVGLGPLEQRDLARLVVASGPLPESDVRRVRVHRGDETFMRDIYAYVHDGDQSQTLQLEDGDVVLIPLNYDTAMVTGAVMRAGPVSVADPENRELSEILVAAGPLPTADLRGVTVYRGDTGTVYDFSGLRDPAALPPKTDVLPGDRIFVPGLNTTTVLVTGAVVRQGTVELTLPEQRDLAKTVVAAGPFPTADLSRVILHRGDEATTYDVKAYVEQGDESQTTVLEDGDRILVPDLASNSIMVTGQVARPGALPAMVGHKPQLFAVVTLAGPSAETADLTQVTIYRNGERLVRDIQKLQEEGDLSQDMQLEPGDVVFVPEATETIVFMGEVERPGAMNIHRVKQRDLARLLPAVSPKPDSGLDRVSIYRNGEIIVKNYRALAEEADLSQNIELEPGDFIYVPTDDTHNIMVLGALTRTGMVNVREEMNRDLLRIVTLMTPLPTADLSRVTVYREDQEPIYRDFKLLMDEGDLSQNMKVEPGDVVVVPRLDEVYIIGAVNKPGAYPAQTDWELLDALAAAGNISRGGQQRVIVIRRRPDGTTEHINISLLSLRRGELPEPVKIKAGDVLYVPPAKQKKKWGWRDIRDALLMYGVIRDIFH